MAFRRVVFSSTSSSFPCPIHNKLLSSPRHSKPAQRPSETYHIKVRDKNDYVKCEPDGTIKIASSLWSMRISRKNRASELSRSIMIMDHGMLV